MSTLDEPQPADDTSATVYPFPERTPGAELEPAVVDGVLLTDAENAALDARRPRGELVKAHVVKTRTVAVRTARQAHAVATHDTTVTAVKLVARNVLYVPAGLSVVARRVWDSRTTSRHERMMRAAETAGDYAAVAEWEERGERFKQQRHGRAMDWLDAPVKLVKALVVACLSLLAVLVGLGIVLACTKKDISAFLDPFTAVINLVEWIVVVVTVAWGPLVLAAPWVAVLYLWNTGRRHTEPPRWIASTAMPADGREIVPDESAVLGALRHLGIAKLNDAFKQGWGQSVTPLWPQVPIREGKGWWMQLALPRGVPVEEIVKKKPVLAHNLVRLPVEVWPSEPKNRPGVLDLWVADQGALSGPVEDWPLLHEGCTDYFKGVPVGFNIRGDLVSGRLSETNWAFAGIMGSGKSTLIITLLLGAMLDPLVDIDVFVLATNADYEPMAPRLRTLRTGSDRDVVVACMDNLRELYADLTVRGQALQQHDERAVNRKLAETDERLRPRIVVIDECQALFMDSELGEEAADMTVKLISAARKYGITLMFATPEASTASLPRKVMAVVSCKACFAIGDQQSNDAILGTGSYKQGVSAVSLEPKTAEGPGDIGTAMTRGVMAKPGLLRSCYVRKGDGIDDVTPVVERAMALRANAGISTEQAPSTPEPAEVDTLADIARVLGKTSRMRTTEVLQRLATLNPSYYTGWSLEDLTEYLTPHHAEPYKTSGYMQISRTRITEALTERDESDGGGDGDE